jgi:hypothetical protein
VDVEDPIGKVIIGSIATKRIERFAGSPALEDVDALRVDGIG